MIFTNQENRAYSDHFSLDVGPNNFLFCNNNSRKIRKVHFVRGNLIVFFYTVRLRHGRLYGLQLYTYNLGIHTNNTRYIYIVVIISFGGILVRRY